MLILTSQYRKDCYSGPLQQPSKKRNRSPHPWHSTELHKPNRGVAPITQCPLQLGNLSHTLREQHNTDPLSIILTSLFKLGRVPLVVSLSVDLLVEIMMKISEYFSSMTRVSQNGERNPASNLQDTNIS